MLYPITCPRPGRAEDQVGYIDAWGRVIVTPNYALGAHFSEGLGAVCSHGGATGFIDTKGELIIPFQFEGLGWFHEGLCYIGFRGRAGYIDRLGRWQVQPRRILASSRFSEGVAAASLDGYSCGYVDRTDTFVIPPSYEQAGDFSSGFAAVERDGTLGYIDRAGTVVIPFIFEGPAAGPFTNGRAAVVAGGRWGYVNSAGHWVVMPQFEDARRFYDGVAPVKTGGKWGLIDTAGRIRCVPKFDAIDEFDAGMAAASLTGKAGFISPEGEWIIEPRFDRCYRFYGGLALVTTGETYSYISRCGSVVWTSEPLAMPPVPPYRE